MVDCKKITIKKGITVCFSKMFVHTFKCLANKNFYHDSRTFQYILSTYYVVSKPTRSYFTISKLYIWTRLLLYTHTSCIGQKVKVLVQSLLEAAR